MIKKILSILGLLLIPTALYAATAVPWQLTNPTDSVIVPSKVNGVIKGVIATSTTQIYINSNRIDSYTADGTELFPYKTITAANTAVAANTSIATAAYWIAPGTYAEQGQSFPSIPLVIHSNGATILALTGASIGAGTFTFPSDVTWYDASVFGNVAYTSTSITNPHTMINPFIAGNVSYSGLAFIQNGAIVDQNKGLFPFLAASTTGSLISNAGSLVNVSGSQIQVVVRGAGFLNLDDAGVFTSTSTAYAITMSSGGQLAINGATIMNGSTGGGINCADSASAATPNEMTNFSVTVGVGTPAANAVSCGSAFSYINMYVANTFAGTRLYASGTALNALENVGLNVEGNSYQNVLSGSLSGFGTSSPFADLSIQANAVDLTTTLFAIGSSTASATTTLFKIDNAGNITTSMTGTQCVHEINGLLSGTGSDCGSGGGGSFPFTPFSWGNATGTTLGFQNGFISNASSTFTSTLWDTNLAGGNLFVGQNGQILSEASSSLFGFTPLNPTRQLTVAGTAQQITSSAGAQDLSADRTWTLSIPSYQALTSFSVTSASTSNATTTGSQYFTGITSSVPLYVDSNGKLGSAGTGSSGDCVKWGANNTLADQGSACGSGSGSGGGTWSTTTSLVAGELMNFSNNNTDIVSVGGNSTSTAAAYIDPNQAAGPFEAIGATTSPFARLAISLSSTTTHAQTAFYIGSSTPAGATTTLFSIDAGGNIQTTMTGTACVHEVNGILSAFGSDCMTDTVGSWFTPTASYNGTSTAIGFLNGAFTSGSTTISTVGTGLVGANNGWLYGISTTSMNASITGSAGSVANSVTFNSSGGAAANSSFNGSGALTVDYHTVGAQQAGNVGNWFTPASGWGTSNSTSTLTGFANGLYSYASSTFVGSTTLLGAFVPTGGIDIGDSVATTSGLGALIFNKNADNIGTAISQASSTGLAMFTTTDQNLNYVVGQLGWNGTAFTMRATNGGSGNNGYTAVIGTRSRTFVVDENGTQGEFYGYINGTGSGTTAVGITTGRTNALATNIELNINPTYTLSGAGGYTDLRIRPIESTLGTGLADLVQLGTSTNSNLFVIDHHGHVMYSGDTPTLSAGTFMGTSTDSGGKIVTAAGAGTTLTMTFADAWPFAPICLANFATTTSAIAASTTLTTVVFTYGSVNNVVFNYNCFGTN